jgi:hypothetical protein
MTQLGTPAMNRVEAAHPLSIYQFAFREAYGSAFCQFRPDVRPAKGALTKIIGGHADSAMPLLQAENVNRYRGDPAP